MAKPNYSFEKRQRDLEKKRKQEEKRLKKLADKKPAAGEFATDSTSDSSTDDEVSGSDSSASTGD